MGAQGGACRPGRAAPVTTPGFAWSVPPLPGVLVLGALLMLGATVALLLWRLSSGRHAIDALQAQLRMAHGAQQSLQERATASESRLRILLESEPECVKLHTADGTVLEMNPAGMAMIEAEDLTDVVGRPVYIWIAPEHRAAYADLTRRVFDGETGRLEFRALSLKGNMRWLETSAAPLRDCHGSIIALLGVTRDMTERRQAEEQDRQHLSALAHVVRTCTMGEMATGLAHELNQPLSAIVNYTRGSLRRLRINPMASREVLDSLDQVCQQAERAAAVIRNLRNFLTKKEPSLTALDINEVVSRISALVEADARQHNVSLMFDLSPELPRVKAASIEIEQVLINLMRNAIESMVQATSPCREIRIATECDDGGMVAVTVADSGPGISSPDPMEVFQPYFTSKNDGMGMGLPISRSIIEAHGGRLWLKKNDHEGATFRFTLHTERERGEHDQRTHRICSG